MSALDLYSIYATMGSVALAATPCIRLWVEKPSLTCPDAHIPPGLDKIPWQGNEQVHWLEMNEPTYDNILCEIDRVLECGYRYQWLIAAIAEGTLLVCSDPDEALPLAEMVTIQSDLDVRIWLSVYMLDEPMGLLFYGYCGSASQSGTDASVNLHFTHRHYRGLSPDASESNDHDSSDRMNPEWSGTAAKRLLLSKTTMTKNRTRNTGTVRPCVMADIDKWGSDTDIFYDAGANLASTEIQDLCSNTPPPPGEQS